MDRATTSWPALAAALVALAGCSLTPSAARSSASPAGTATATPAATGSGAAAPAVEPPPGGPVPQRFEPNSLTFVSATEGWVLGTAPCSQPPCTSIVRTRDGGRTWKGIPAPKAALYWLTNQTGGVKALRFADRLNGWAFGPELFVTHDGGGHWAAQPIPGGAPGGQVVDLEAAAGTVYALVASGDPGRPRPVQLYRGAVGRDEWQPVTGVAAEGATITEGFGAGLVLHGRTAWALIGQDQGEAVFATSDGSRWEPRTLPCLPPASGLALATASDLLLVCGGGVAAGSQEKTAYVSHDAGRSFQRAGSPPSGGDLEGAAAAPGVALVSAASGASFLYASFDGGRTWAEVFSAPTGGEFWIDLGMTTSSQGAAVLNHSRPEGSGYSEPPRLVMTRDGGHSWSQVAFTQAG